MPARVPLAPLLRHHCPPVSRSSLWQRLAGLRIKCSHNETVGKVHALERRAAAVAQSLSTKPFFQRKTLPHVKSSLSVSFLPPTTIISLCLIKATYLSCKQPHERGSLSSLSLSPSLPVTSTSSSLTGHPNRSSKLSVQLLFELFIRQEAVVEQLCDLFFAHRNQ